jgi:hypothetical protein
MRKCCKVTMALRTGIGAAVLASAAFMSGPASANSALCSASSSVGRQNATVTELTQAPGVCLRVLQETPAAPNTPDCWTAASYSRLNCQRKIITLQADQAAQCSASSSTGRQEATIAESSRDPNVCIRVKLGTPAAPGNPSCWEAARTQGLSCTNIVDLDSPAEAAICSASGLGQRQEAFISVSDRDPNVCIRVKLDIPVAPGVPSCWQVRGALGCTHIVDLN